MTFVSKGMAQNSGKSHLCNVKYGKHYDGEQQVLVFLKVLWYANKCIVTDFRIHIFCGQKVVICCYYYWAGSGGGSEGGSGVASYTLVSGEVRNFIYKYIYACTSFLCPRSVCPNFPF